MSDPNSGLRQGEILTGIRLPIVNEPIDEDPDITPARIEKLKYAIIVTQDCDLEKDWLKRSKSQKGILPTVLICVVIDENELLGLPKAYGFRFAGSDRTQPQPELLAVLRNKDERFHYLRQIDPAQELQREGLPHLYCFFRYLYAVSPEYLYSSMQNGSVRRRCFLKSPYLEQFALRFHYFHSRVGLPQDHYVE